MGRVLALITGLLCAVTFAAASIAAVVTFKDGIYSPLNCFVTELGLNTVKSHSSALIFNIGLIASGLLFAALMTIFGIQKDKPFYTAASFFGILSGILICAQGIFNLSYGIYHLIIIAAFFICVFIMCALCAVGIIMFDRTVFGFVIGFFELLCAVAAAALIWYVLSGGMQRIFYEDSLGVGRLGFIPFAPVGWAAYILFFVLSPLMSLRLFFEKAQQKAAEPGGVEA